MTFEEALRSAAANVHKRDIRSARPGAGPSHGMAPGRMSGKIAVVTGGAQGFGYGISEALYREGASVVVADMNRETGAAAAERLGPRAGFAYVDVSDEESVKALVCAAVERFGGIDIFVSHAGILKAGDLDHLTTEEFDKITAVNYKGYYLCVKYASAVMRAQYEADNTLWHDIVQTNSKSGLVGSKANFAYAGGKFGCIGLTQSFAMDLAPYQIKVNSICPGNYYDGPLWSDPEKGLFVQYLRAGKVPGAQTVEDVRAFYQAKSLIQRGCLPEDVAKALFYCVEQRYETGQAIPVTGGQVMLS